MVFFLSAMLALCWLIHFGKLRVAGQHGSEQCNALANEVVFQFTWNAAHVAGHHQALASLPDEAGNTAPHTRPGSCQENVALFDFNHRTRRKAGRKKLVVLGLKFPGLNRRRL